MGLNHRAPDYESGALPTELLIAVHNLAHRSGIEPLALCSTGRRSPTELTMHFLLGGKMSYTPTKLERMARIELA